MKKIKSENQILIMLAFLSISMGLWENFRQLWLQDNGFSATDISTIISIGTLISVLGIIFVGKYIRLDKLKAFVSCSLLIKFLNLLILLKLNNTNNIVFINISIVIDVLTSYLITTSIYPLITTIIKNNTIYSKRKLTEYLFKDVGVLIGGILIGKIILGVLINYNICLFISIIFLGIAIIVMFNMTATCKQEEKARTPILRYIMKNKIQVIYMVYTFIGATAFSTALGLKMLTFTNYLNFADSTATNYLLVIGLLADFIGILALKYLTPKNDYITITIKFGIRFMAYAIAFFVNNVIVALIAITWSILISTSYENICDGYYINAINNEYQFRYTNLRYIIRYLGEAVGVFLCGIMYEIGLRYMLGLSAVFMLFQIGLAYYLIFLRNKEKSIRDKRITLISFIDQTETRKIENLMSKMKEKNCKVPFGINDDKRYEIDNLPYHFTIFATNKENQNKIIKLAEKINIDKIQVKINDIKIMNAKCNSYCLYLSIEENKQIKELQRKFYNVFPKEKYNPDDFIFHMTLHIDKDYKKVLELQRSLKQNFEPFFIQFDTLALFDYPGKMIKKINLKNNYRIGMNLER